MHFFSSAIWLSIASASPQFFFVSLLFVSPHKEQFAPKCWRKWSRFSTCGGSREFWCVCAHLLTKKKKKKKKKIEKGGKKKRKARKIGGFLFYPYAWIFNYNFFFVVFSWSYWTCVLGLFWSYAYRRLPSSSQRYR